jgi:hypothetical protein
MSRSDYFSSKRKLRKGQAAGPSVAIKWAKLLELLAACFILLTLLSLIWGLYLMLPHLSPPPPFFPLVLAVYTRKCLFAFHIQTKELSFSNRAPYVTLLIINTVLMKGTKIHEKFWLENIVPWRLNDDVTEPEKWPLLGYGTVPRQLSNSHARNNENPTGNGVFCVSVSYAPTVYITQL